MTLHEAIKIVLEESGRELRAVELATEINNRNLYQRRDGGPVPSSQIHARVKNYLNIFYKNNGKVGLIDFSKGESNEVTVTKQKRLRIDTENNTGLKLHEAIQLVLNEKDRVMTPSEIAEEINSKKLYQRADGILVPSSQISARISKYLDLFNKFTGKIGINKNNNIEALLDKYQSIQDSKTNRKLQMSSSKKLHEAIEKAFKGRDVFLTINEIADNVNSEKLYVRKDGNPVPHAQIVQRINNYPEIFIRKKGKIGLVEFYKPESFSDNTNLNYSDLLHDLDNYLIQSTKLLNEERLFFVIELAIFINAEVNTSDKQTLSSAYIDYDSINAAENSIDKLIDSIFGASIQNHFDIQFDSLDIPKILHENPVFYKSTLDINERELFQFLRQYLNSSKVLDQNKLQQHQTPNNISHLIQKIITDLKFSSIYDPFLGMGNSLLSAQKGRDKIQLYGQEINATIIKLARLNIFLSTNNNIQLSNKSSIEYPIISTNSVDLIVSEPPFNLRIKVETKPDFKRISKDNTFENYAFEMMLSRLTKKGKMITIMPSGFLVNERSKALRKYIIESDFLDTVIQLPKGSFSPYSGTAASIIIVDKNKNVNRKDKTLFIDLINLGNAQSNSRIRGVSKWDQEIFQKIADIYYSKDHVQNNIPYEIVTNHNLINNSYSLSPSQYTSNITSKIDLLEEDETIKEIRDVVSLLKCSKVSVNDTDLKVVDIKDLNDNKELYLNINSLNDFNPKYKSYKIVEQNAILVARIGKNFKPTIFRYSDQRIAISGNIIPLVITNRTIDIEYLVIQLKTDIVKEQLSFYQYGTAQLSLRSSDLFKIKIPVPLLSQQYERITAYYESLTEKSNLVKFIDEINLVESKADIQHEIEKYTRKVIVSDQINYNDKLEVEKFPFSEKDIANKKYIKWSNDKQYQYLLIINKQNKDHGYISVAKEVPIEMKDYLEINAYANFLINTSKSIFKKAATDSLAKFAHTSKNFFSRISSDIRPLLDGTNPELESILNKYHIESDSILKRKIKQGKNIDDYLAINRLKSLGSKISALANFYQLTDSSFKQIQDDISEEVDIKEILKECLSTISSKVEYNPLEERLTVITNKSILKQSLIDLLQNADKYSSNNEIIVMINDNIHLVTISIQNKVDKVMDRSVYEKLGNEWLTLQNESGISAGFYWAKKSIENFEGTVSLIPFDDYEKNKVFEVRIKLKKAM